MTRTDTEQALRVDLAACYRLVALFGWDDLVFTHISARIPGPEHHCLINPYGMLFEEITASSLVKVDASGAKVEPSDYPVNPAGFVIHSAIHAAREKVTCVLHTHTRSGVAVSAQRDGLLPISQQATVALASLGYHDYEGIVGPRRRKAPTGVRPREPDLAHPAKPRAPHGWPDHPGCVPSDVRARERLSNPGSGPGRWDRSDFRWESRS